MTDQEGAHGGPETHSEPAEHGAEELGPIDWPAWSMSVVGIALAVVICVFMALPTLGG